MLPRPLQARAFYSFQAFKQNIHSEALGGLLSVLMPEEQQQAALFRKMRANPLMQRKVEWAKCWLLRCACCDKNVRGMVVTT